MAAGRRKSVSGYLTKGELALWSISVFLVLASFLLFDRANFLSLAAALIGVTSLILCAKGNPSGQVLMILFSVLYGIISYKSAYYGEMITYLGMTAPMAVLSLIAWLRNPYEGNRAEVRVNGLGQKEILFMLPLSAVITVAFYFILAAFRTSSLLLSTLSVTTSFLAAYLTFRRSVLYAIGYAANDVVLIVLWIIAARRDIALLSVVICFVTFLANDIYGYVSWSKMQKRQEAGL